AAPTGTVDFSDGATVLCSNVSLSTGVASCVVPSVLAVGTHPMIVSYSGDASFLPGTSSALNQPVVRGTATTSVIRDVATAVYGQTVTFTATVDPDSPAVATPTGTVTFRDSATVICANVAIVSGEATCAVSNFGLGFHAVSARYNGSSGYSPSTSF